MPETLFDPQTTALVVIDLQKGIVAIEGAPYPTSDVVMNAAALVKTLRPKGSTIVYVHVDLANLLKFPADRYMRDPNGPPPPPEASEIVSEAGRQPNDLVITKRQWGAFFGTDLEAQLKKRGIRTIILCGIATNFGVESTARAATGLGFELITVEDACTSVSTEAHRFAMEKILPLIGRVRTVADIIAIFGD